MLSIVLDVGSVHGKVYRYNGNRTRLVPRSIEIFMQSSTCTWLIEKILSRMIPYQNCLLYRYDGFFASVLHQQNYYYTVCKKLY